jgi:hypothetical protein
MNLCEVLDSSIIDTMKDKSIGKHWVCDYLSVVTNGFVFSSGMLPIVWANWIYMYCP